LKLTGSAAAEIEVDEEEFVFSTAPVLSRELLLITRGAARAR